MKLEDTKRYIMCDPDTYWQVIVQQPDYKLLLDITKTEEAKGFFKDIPVFIKRNDKLQKSTV